jgi:hypothetical protein
VEKLNSISQSGNISVYTLEFHERITSTAIGLSVLFFILFVLSIVYRNKCSEVILKSMKGCREVFLDFKKLIISLSWAEKIYIFVITIVGLLLRLYYISIPAKYDETYSFLYYATKPLYYFLSYYGALNNHIFHTLLMSMSTILFGEALWVLRLPAFIAGLLIIPASYFVVKKVYSEYAATLVSACLACLSMLIEYSVNGRGYTLIVLFSILLLGLTHQVLSAKGMRFRVLWIVCAAFGFWTVPIMVLPIGMCGLWMLFEQLRIHRKIILADLVICASGFIILSVILYAPVLIVSGKKLLLSNPTAPTSQSYAYFFSHAWIFSKEIWIHWNRNLSMFVSIMCGLGFGVHCVQSARLKKNTFPLAMIVIMLAYILVFPSSGYLRVWIFLGVYFFIVSISLIATFMTTFLKNYQYIVAALFVVSMSALELTHAYVSHSTETGKNAAAEKVIEEIAKKAQLGGVILGVNPVHHYYLKRSGLEFTIAVLSQPGQVHTIAFQIPDRQAIGSRKIFLIDDSNEVEKEYLNRIMIRGSKKEIMKFPDSELTIYSYSPK